MRPNAKDRDRAGDQHLAREDALALLDAGDIGHRLDLVFAGPALWRNNAFSRSVYARESAYGTTWPRFLSLVVFVTRHRTWSGENGTSSSGRSLFTSSPEGDVVASSVGMARHPPSGT